MRRTIVAALAAASLLAPAVVSASPGLSGDPGALRDLAAARRATVEYRDLAAATADGYVGVGGCVGIPGVGAMGVHHANFGLFDMTVDPAQPEGLLYDHSSGRPRLVGVEYLVPFVGQPAPVLFGRPMMGPMAGHEPGMPDHYDLHAWVWQANPDGILSDFNPNLSC